MRDLLIRYLLGELDADEHEELQQRLAASPELRRELARLRSCFAAASHSDDPAAEPPSGLARRTSDLVASGELAPADLVRQREAALKAAADAPSGVLGWSLADLTVAGGVVLAVSMLLFPALGDSRNASRRNVCQNNQRQLGTLLFVHAQFDRGRYFPRIAPDENAGMFALRLAERGHVSPDELASLLVCPGAPLAEAVRAGQFAVWIPDTSELHVLSPQELASARKKMSPFYAYRFPWRQGEQFHYIRHVRNVRDDERPLSPLLADAPGSERDGMMSPNHGGTVIQVLCSDGSVRSFTSTILPGLDDDLFTNHLGQVAAGCDPGDTVLGPSEATPTFNWHLRRR